MAFPTVSARATGSESGATTSHAITLPTHAVGQMLLVHFRTSDETDTTVINTGVSGTNWKTYARHSDPDGIIVLWKIAETTSDALTLTTTNTTSVHISHSISDANWLSGSSSRAISITNPNPIAHTEDVSRDHLWMTVAGGEVAGIVPTVAPTGYGNLQSSSAFNISVTTAEKNAAASTEDPGAWTAASDTWNLHTLAIWQLPTDSHRFRFPIMGLADWTWVRTAQSGSWSETLTDESVTGINDEWSTDYPVGAGVASLRTRQRNVNGGVDSSLTGYWQWTGNLEDLDVPAGNVLTDYGRTSYWYKLSHLENTSSTSTFDRIEIIDSSTRTLVPAQTSYVNTDLGWTRETNDPAISALSLDSTQSVEIRIWSFNNSNISSGWAQQRQEWTWLELEMTSEVGNVDLASTTTATSVVTPTLLTEFTFATSLAVTSTVTSNLQTGRAFMSSTIAQSAIVNADFRSITPLFSSTTNVVSTVTPVLDVKDTTPTFASTTTATSAVTPVLTVKDTTPTFATTVAVTSTVSGHFNNGKPFVAGAPTTGFDDALVTSYVVPLPAHQAGQFLIAFIANGDAATSATSDYTTGWRVEGTSSNGGTDANVKVAYKIAESDSETLTVEITAAEKWKSITYAVDDADAYFNTSENGGFFTASTSPPFEQIIMDESREVVSLLACAASQDGIVTVVPTGYGNLTTLQGGTSSTDVSLSTMYRNVTTTTEAPSNATLSSSQGHPTMTFIVYKRDPEATTFHRRFTFNDTTSFFQTIADDPVIIDGIWESLQANQSPVGAGWVSRSSAGPQATGATGADEVFWTLGLNGTGGVGKSGFVEFNGTWADLGVPATATIISYEEMEVYWSVWGITAGDDGRIGTSTNDAVEITDSSGTHVLIPKQAVATTDTGWTLASNTPSIVTNVIATDPITIRIYAEANELVGTTVTTRFEDMRMNLVTEGDAPGQRTFATTVAATSAVNVGSFGVPVLFASTITATATASSNAFVIFISTLKKITQWTQQTQPTGVNPITISVPSGSNRVMILTPTNVGGGTGTINGSSYAAESDQSVIGTSTVGAANGSLYVFNESTIAGWGASVDLVFGARAAGESNQFAYAFWENAAQPSPLVQSTTIDPVTGNFYTWAYTGAITSSALVAIGWIDNDEPVGTTPSFLHEKGQLFLHKTSVGFGTNDKDLKWYYYDSTPQDFPVPWNFGVIPEADTLELRITDVGVTSAHVIYAEIGSQGFRNIANVNAVSDVNASLATTRLFASTTTVASTVNGNIDATRKLLGTTVAQSAVITPTNLEVLRPLISTTNAVSIITAAEWRDASPEFATAIAATSALQANLGLTVFLDSLTTAVSTVNPNEFFYGFETSLAATSTVSATLDRQPKFTTTVAAVATITADEFHDASVEFVAAVVAQSALVTGQIERTVNWNSVTSVAAAVFPSTVEVARPFIADVNSSTSMEGNIRLAGRFATVIAVQSLVDPTELERVRGYNSTTTVVSDSHGNIVQGLRFLSLTVAQSALVTTNLNRAVTWNSNTAVASALTVGDFQRFARVATSLAVQSTVSTTLVVITNTLQLTFCETYFLETSERVLTLTTDCVDSIVTVNETDTLTPTFIETGADVLVTITTDN